MFRQVKKAKDYEPETISWEREGRDNLTTPLMFIYPQPGEKIKDKKYFAVKEYEKVLFYNKGTLVDFAGSGLYEIDKNARTKGTELVWIDTAYLDIPWGIAITQGIPTKEGCKIGLHGDLKLRINDAKTFYQKVVAGKKMWTRLDIKDWIMGLLHTSLRDIFKTYSTNSIVYEDRERVILQTTAKLTEEFMLYGFELTTFNIKNIKMPEKYERIEELYEKRKKLQDDFLDGRLKQEEYDEKAKNIERFINEILEELKKSEENLSKI